ncbi:MAG: potassium-transporting ATPase subunit KdpA [Gammaproteobacteria bacterium]
MTAFGLINIVVYLAVLLLCVKPLGGFMASVYLGECVRCCRWVLPFENLIYRLSGVNPKRDMRWQDYAMALLVFNVIGLLAVFGVQRLQAYLPLNPQGLPAVRPDTAFNSAVSFTSNTNWQSYGGETTMSYFTQMVGLTVQNFLSAATGMAALAVLIRGFARRNSDGIGNFWVDLTRSVLYILLPLSLILALLLAGQGVVQTFRPYQTVELSDPVIVESSQAETASVAESRLSRQALALGPAASQVAIKQLGTNGGGFFNVNSAHPYENPSPLSNFLEMLAILIIPAALCYTFGSMVGDIRQAWALLAAMSAVFVAAAVITIYAEQTGNPVLNTLGVDQTASESQPGGNMEGKELRFGIAASSLWATATTAASNGSVNAMHDSFTPVGGLGPMWLMQLGEVIFGGVGSGLYGMVVFAMLAVFVAGLMIGRTPEYLGKKIEAFEIKMAAVAILIPPLVVLGGSALAVMLETSRLSAANPGAHGFSEILYAFSSAGNNNGSAFAGLNANTHFYNLALGLAMLFARYWLIVPVLAIAGSLAAKKTVPPGSGTLPTHTALFVLLLIGTVLMVGALTFLPALALGPIVEQLQLSRLQ